MTNKFNLINIFLLAVIAITTLNCTKEASSEEYWNRRIEGLSITNPPTQGEPHTITTFLTISSKNLKKPLNLSTDIIILINNKAIDTITVDLSSQSNFNALAVPDADRCGICPGGTKCICYDGKDCACRTFHCEPTPVQLSVNDEISLLLHIPDDAQKEMGNNIMKKTVKYEGISFLAITPIGNDNRSSIRILE